MKTTHDYTFDACLSQQNYDHKPSRDKEVPALRFRKITTNIDEFASAIRKGYCYTPVFKYAAFGMTDKTDANFCYSSFISIDIDHTNTDMNTMIGNIKYKPTICYTSCSNGLDGKYSYRLIYCFDYKIEGNREYSNCVHTLLDANHIPIELIDKRSLKASQYYNGNGCDNAEISVSHIIYSKDDFIEYYKEYNNILDNSKSIIENHTLKTQYNIHLNDTFENKEFEKDYWNMKMEDILVKYINVYPNMEHTPLDIPDDDTPYIMFPSGYTEIRRWWRKSLDGTPIKIKDGEGRRRKLFINAVIRRLINPDITFDNLLYNLLFELVNYISNYKADNKVDKRVIYQIAIDAMNKDMALYEHLRGTKKQFMVNPNFCIKYGLSKTEVKSTAGKIIRYNKIGELYDCSLNDSKNLEIMKEHGLVISPITLKRWRKENGITKYQKKAT